MTLQEYIKLNGLPKVGTQAYLVSSRSWTGPSYSLVKILKISPAGKKLTLEHANGTSEFTDSNKFGTPYLDFDVQRVSRVIHNRNGKRAAAVAMNQVRLDTPAQHQSSGGSLRTLLQELEQKMVAAREAVAQLDDD